MRTCIEQDCQREAPHVAGYYVVGPGRRVRVWKCLSHYIAGGHAGKPAVEVPQPAFVAAAERAEREHREAVAESVRKTPVSRERVSVLTLASTGHGEKIPGDPIANWRWMGW